MNTKGNVPRADGGATPAGADALSSTAENHKLFSVSRATAFHRRLFSLGLWKDTSLSLAQDCASVAEDRDPASASTGNRALLRTPPGYPAVGLIARLGRVLAVHDRNLRAVHAINSWCLLLGHAQFLSCGWLGRKSGFGKSPWPKIGLPPALWTFQAESKVGLPGVGTVRLGTTSRSMARAFEFAGAAGCASGPRLSIVLRIESRIAGLQLCPLLCSASSAQALTGALNPVREAAELTPEGVESTRRSPPARARLEIQSGREACRARASGIEMCS
jgi:hypothetical protein